MFRSCLTLALLLPVAAIAQTAPAPQPSTTTAPMPPADRAAHVFAKVDQNRDGTISLDEWKAAGRREQGFRRMDSDGDGKVTQAELSAGIARLQARKR